MTRPSRDLDCKLIDAGRAMLPRAGLSGLSVREVCRKAGVNAGMFHYHFKNKDAFVRRLLQETYEDFFVTFREAAEGSGAPLDRLRRVLVAFGRFARENRVFYVVLARELLNDQPQCLAFLRENFPRHLAIIAQLIKECRAAGAVRPLPLPAMVAFAMTSLGVPGVMVAALERHRPRRIFGEPFSRWSGMMLSDAVIEARADMVLAGLRSARA